MITTVEEVELIDELVSAGVHYGGPEAMTASHEYALTILRYASSRDAEYLSEVLERMLSDDGWQQQVLG